MEYINKVQLRGRVGYLRKRDINGTEVASFSVAVEMASRRRTGEAVTVTTYIYCEAWSGQKCNTERLEQGCEVEVFGRIATRKYAAADGTERSVTEVKVAALDILSYPEPAPAPEPEEEADEDMPF